jgi:hypothetical protein
LSVAMETQELFPFLLFSNTKYFVLLSTDLTHLVLYVKYPILLFDFDQIWSYSTDFRKGPQYLIWQNPSSGAALILSADGWTDTHDEAKWRLSLFIRTRLKFWVAQDMSRFSLYLHYKTHAREGVKHSAELELPKLTFKTFPVCYWTHV